MEYPPQQVRLSPGVKRSHDGQIVTALSHVNDTTPVQHLQPVPRLRSQSPALSTASSSLTELSSTVHQTSTATVPGSPSKKKKLTFAEKQVKKAQEAQQREEKARLKAEEKAQKDEEKRIRDEEKRKKAEEKEAIKRVKDVEKAEKEAARTEKKKQKDAEKAKKEMEKFKKERAQMRLGAFFVPAPASTPPSTPDDMSSGVSSRRSSIASVDLEQPEIAVKASSVNNPGYASWILPFFPHEHTDIAPTNRFLIRNGTSAFDSTLSDPAQHASVSTLEPLGLRFRRSKRLMKPTVPVKTIIARLSGSEDRSIDLTAGSTSNATDQSLAQIPYKVLSFREDIRPPYQGTFSRSVLPGAARRMSRKPSYRGLPNVDYDYDSEAEWEPPEAGDEELEDEDEMSDEEDAADDMADFLDDGEEIARRRVTVADVEATCTGLHWEDEVGASIAGINMAVYRMDVLHDDTRLPIDPYSTMHWAEVDKTTSGKGKGPLLGVDESMVPSMQPPRLPLAAVSVPNGSSLKNYVKSIVGMHVQKENEVPGGKQSTNSKKPTKMIPSDILPAFKKAVAGSDLNKVALIEILKKQFPKCPKDAIKGTLESIAVRQGAKEVDKRWVLIAS